MSISFSYAITVHNESIKTLIDRLREYVSVSDEIVILDDYSTNEETLRQISRADVVIRKKFLNHYGNHKNILFDFCKGAYIFQLDGDELPTEDLLKSIKTLVSNKPTIELFRIPRENYLDGLVDENTKQYKFKIDKKERINYPDYQGRIYKNKTHIRWVGTVHERITGHTTSYDLKQNTSNFILHRKELSKQIISNQKYNDIRYTPTQTNFNLCVVTCYFNPCNYLSKFLNCIDFISHITSYGIKCIVIESYNESSKYKISNVHADTIAIHNNSVYWQKEALLNIGIKYALEKDYEYIATLDNDIEFISDDWCSLILKSAKFYGMTHVFEYAYKETQVNKMHKQVSSCKLLKNLTLNDNIKTILKRIGEPGYGYCFHKNTLLGCELFDKAIMGTGDLLNLLGFQSNSTLKDTITNDRFFQGMTTDFIDTYLNWCNTTPSLINGIGFTHTDIKINYHGTLKNRDYINREFILKKFEYSPSIHLTKQETGLFELNHVELESKIKDYFASRQEDDHLKLNSKVIPVKINRFIERNTISKEKKVKYIISETNEIKNYYKKTITGLNSFQIKSNLDYMVVASRYNSDTFPIGRIQTDNKVLIDKSNSPMPHSVHTPHIGGHIHSYFSFIAKFYNHLPNHCIFINETIKDAIPKYTKFINDILLTTLNDGYTPLLANKKISKLGEHILNHKKQITPSPLSFSLWWKQNVHDPKPSILYYNPKNNFIVDRATIHKKPISYYTSVLNRLNKEPMSEEEVFISHSLSYLFK